TPQPELAAVFRFRFLREPLAVQKGPVATPQILDEQTILSNTENTVPAANGITFWSQITFVTTPNEKFVSRNLQFPPRTAPTQHLQLDLHITPFMPSCCESLCGY